MKFKMETLVDFIVRSYSEKNLWVLFVGVCICAILMAIAALVIGVGQPIDGSNARIQILDTMLNYSQEEAYEQIKAYGETGRTVCVFTTLILDSLFPLFYGSFMSLILVFLFQATQYRMLIIMPLLILLVDYVENTHLAFLVINFPEELPDVVYWANLVTITKWTLVGLVLMAISFGFFLRNRKHFFLEVERRRTNFYDK
ncbi:MAG: Unknown protein [uncultured Aureispira sp.]|uniref:Uncharacterized protein n=1 Tax=uncultured Aureispira sp. TaxID=1331704 RepID=A0A6S6S9B2_9BACT|nr:MAG: Unknown protein [uncultured Aureispira sp.]